MCLPPAANISSKYICIWSRNFLHGQNLNFFRIIERLTPLGFYLGDGIIDVLKNSLKFTILSQVSIFSFFLLARLKRLYYDFFFFFTNGFNLTNLWLWLWKEFCFLFFFLKYLPHTSQNWEKIKLKHLWYLEKKETRWTFMV